MRRYETLPPDVDVFIADSIRRDALNVKILSELLFKNFGIRRGKSWIADYINKTLRPQMAEDARLERRLRLLKREFGDRPEVLAKAAAAVMNNNSTPADRHRQKKAAAQ